MLANNYFADCWREPFLSGCFRAWNILHELGLSSRITLRLIFCGRLSFFCI